MYTKCNCINKWTCIVCDILHVTHTHVYMYIRYYEKVKEIVGNLFCMEMCVNNKWWTIFSENHQFSKSKDRERQKGRQFKMLNANGINSPISQLDVIFDNHFTLGKKSRRRKRIAVVQKNSDWSQISRAIVDYFGMQIAENGLN